MLVLQFFILRKTVEGASAMQGKQAYWTLTVDFTLLLFRATLRSSLGSWVLRFEVANYVVN